MSLLKWNNQFRQNAKRRIQECKAKLNGIEGKRGPRKSEQRAFWKSELGKAYKEE